MCKIRRDDLTSIYQIVPNLASDNAERTASTQMDMNMTLVHMVKYNRTDVSIERMPVERINSTVHLRRFDVLESEVELTGSEECLR